MLGYNGYIWEPIRSEKQYVSAVDRREAMVLQKLFLTHPHSVGKSYFVHQRMALSVCFALFGAALVHAPDSRAV